MKSKTIILLFVVSFLLVGCGSDSKEIGTPNVTDKEGELGFLWTYDDIVISIDAIAKDTIDLIKEEPTYYEAASCAMTGIDKIYTYDNFVITISTGEDYEGITKITLKNDLVSTMESVKIGDSYDLIIEKYGKGEESIENVVSYQEEGTELRFIMEDSKIISIEYIKQ